MSSWGPQHLCLIYNRFLHSLQPPTLFSALISSSLTEAGLLHRGFGDFLMVVISGSFPISFPQTLYLILILLCTLLPGLLFQDSANYTIYPLSCKIQSHHFHLEGFSLIHVGMYNMHMCVCSHYCVHKNVFLARENE